MQSRVRTRISASPGLVALVSSLYRPVRLAKAESIAHEVSSIGAARGFPVSDPFLREVRRRAEKIDQLPGAVSAAIDAVPKTKLRLQSLPPARRLTVYGRLASVSLPVKECTPPSARVFAQLEVLRGCEKLSRTSLEAALEKYSNLPADVQGQYDFDLRREAYCQRRFITDRSLHHMAEKHATAAAWCTYADSFDVKVSGRPPLQPVPHFFSAYYEFYREHNPNHFYSQDVIDEIVSVFRTPEFQRLSSVHFAMHAGRRDNWQVKRVKAGMKPPEFVRINPKAYNVEARLPMSLSDASMKFSGVARKHGVELTTNIIEATAHLRTKDFMDAVRKNLKTANEPEY